MHILIVKMSSLGDIVHAFPVLEYLKKCYPQSKIDWVVEHPFAELVRAHPMINQVIPVQTKKWRSNLLDLSAWKEMVGFRRELQKTTYDLVLDLQGNSKSGLVTVLAKSEKKVGFDYSSVPEWPNLLATNKRFSPPSGCNIREDYLFLAQSATGCFSEQSASDGVKLHLSEQENLRLKEVLDQIKEMKGVKVLVCSGSNWANKQLSKETLKDFLQIFSERLNAHFLLVWGNQNEKVVAEEIMFALPQNCSILNRLSLPALQNLMTHIDLVLAMDSLPLHLAGISSTPTYSVFGPSSAKKYKPMGNGHEALQGSCPYDKTFEKRCDILRSCKTGACMKQLKGEEIFKHFHAWWMSLKKTS